MYLHRMAGECLIAARPSNGERGIAMILIEWAPVWLRSGCKHMPPAYRADWV